MEQELLENIKKFWNSAELVYSTKDYTSASILYFKCWFVMIDYILFKKLRKTPKDHTERFSILKRYYPEFYLDLDKYFQVYRDTYSLNILKDKCDEVRANVSKIIKKQDIHI